jgi:hypothetical protein
MPSAITRRAAFTGAGAMSLMVAGSVVPAWWLASDARSALRAMIRTHLRGAVVENGAVDAFADDFLRHYGVRRGGIAIGNACDAFSLQNAAQACTNNAAYLKRLEGRVIDLFVRSTDLLAPDRRVGEPIRYVAFWDPYSGACRNPFADFTSEA